MPKNRSQQLFEHAQKFATPFRTSLGVPWALVPEGADRYRGFALPSPGFRQWLMQSFHTEHFLYPGSNAMETAIGMFTAEARAAGMPASGIFTRVGRRGDRNNPEAVLLHLANAANEMVEITADGWRIASADDIRFMAHSATVPLARPMENSSTLRDHLRLLLHLDGPALNRAVVWLFAALRPAPPYPILVISGPTASGKSVLMRMLRSLIDPCMFPDQDPPANEHILFSQALHNGVLAYEDAGSLPRTTIDQLAQVASGAPEPLAIARPVILTTATGHRAFTEADMRIELAALPAENFVSGAKLAEKYHAAAPAILGTLCSAVSAGLASSSTEVAQWVNAARAILGLTSAQIHCALERNALVDALDALFQTQVEWTGAEAALVEKLQAAGYAGDAEDVQEQLSTIGLAQFGFRVEQAVAGHHRLMHVTRISDVRARSGGSQHLE